MNLNDLNIEGLRQIADGWEKITAPVVYDAVSLKCKEIRDRLFGGDDEPNLSDINSSQIRSSLDVIEDTQMAINSYFEDIAAPSSGPCYVKVYGILQVLFVQQDAVQHLFEALGQSWQKSGTLRNIREIRTRTVGHPTKKDIPKNEPLSFHFISRPTLTQERFQLISEFDGATDQFKDSDIRSLIDEQQKKLKQRLTELDSELQKKRNESK